MTKILFIINAILTLPFGVLALIAPGPVFAGFGVGLDAGGQLIARGYAATLVAYGLIYLLVRGNAEQDVKKVLLIAAAVFNLIEAVIQGLAGADGIASSMIWGNVVTHAVVSVACLWAWRRP